MQVKSLFVFEIFMESMRLRFRTRAREEGGGGVVH